MVFFELGDELVAMSFFLLRVVSMVLAIDGWRFVDVLVVDAELMAESSEFEIPFEVLVVAAATRFDVR